MDIAEQKKILESAKIFFKEKIVSNHIKNTKKLKNLKEFNVNPFLLNYLSNFAFGNTDKINLAKVLIYPRVLGTSITTTFGAQIQTFCCEVLKGFASTTSGIDIEFIDTVDNRRKYCQIKAGPNTINSDDVITIKNHFKAIKNLARTNHLLDFNPALDCIVGVLYGSETDLSSSYKVINEDFPVYIGKDFWARLTGDENFYFDLIQAFVNVVDEVDGSELLTDIIEKLAIQL